MYKNEVWVFLICCVLCPAFIYSKHRPVDPEIGRWIVGLFLRWLIIYFVLVRPAVIITLRVIRGKHWLGRPFPLSLLGVIAIPVFLVLYGRWNPAPSDIHGQEIISVVFFIVAALIGASYLNFVLRLKP